MSKVTVKIPNLAAFEAKLKSSPAIFGKHLQTAITAATFLFTREVKDNIRKGTDMWKPPIATGVMVNTIYPIVSTLRGEIIPQADYSVYVHEGTRFMRARPYLEITEKTAQQEINKIFEDELNSAMGDFAV